MLTNFQLDEMLISVHIALYTSGYTFEDVNINLYTCTYMCTLCTCVCMCVHFSIQTFKYICFICTSLNMCWAVYNCVLMWLPVGIYGISSICQLSQQVHPISQIHSCESEGELWLNNVILLLYLCLYTFTRSYYFNQN